MCNIGLIGSLLPPVLQFSGKYWRKPETVKEPFGALIFPNLFYEEGNCQINRNLTSQLHCSMCLFALGMGIDELNWEVSETVL